MQLSWTIGTKTAVCFWLRCSIWRVRPCDTLQHFRSLPPDPRFQYSNANQFAVSCGLALIAWQLIFRYPSTLESTHQQKCLPFASPDFLQVIARQDESRVLLISPLDFERVCAHIS